VRRDRCSTATRRDEDVPADQVFPLVSRRRLIGTTLGGMRSVRRGRGTDVAGSRPYYPGDDMRMIDWPASARLSSARGTDEFVIRESYAEEAPRVVVVPDHRPSMSLYPKGMPWLVKPQAIRVAARLVVASTIALRGYPGYLDFAESTPRWAPPRSTREPYGLDDERPFTAPHDVLEQALTYLGVHRRALPRGSFIFVLSDFLEPPDERFWIDVLTRSWDVVPVVIQDPVWEQSFPDVAGVVVPFVDERGRVVRARLSADEVAERREMNETRLRGLIDGFQRLGIQHVLVSESEPTSVLTSFLEWSLRRELVRERV
jgi:uncharacterized protein (DUF58 family)